MRLTLKGMSQWQLKRPDVIISVTGGAADFDLSTEESDRIFKAMMDGTRSLDAWFVTGGTNAGVMKYVGEFRRQYNPTAPLIGITPLGIISGLETLRSLHLPPPNKTGSNASASGNDNSKQGWQRLGSKDVRLPTLGVERYNMCKDPLQVKSEQIQERIHKIETLQARLRSPESSGGKVCALSSVGLIRLLPFVS